MSIPSDFIKLRPDSELYLALDGFDLAFYQHEVDAVIECWRDGRNIAEIARYLRRDRDSREAHSKRGLERGMMEIACLIMDLSVRGKLKQHPMDLFKKVKPDEYADVYTQSGKMMSAKAQRQAEQRRKLREEGYCTYCLKQKATEGKKGCQECLDKKRKKWKDKKRDHRAERKQLAAEGFCTTCRSRREDRRPEPGFKTCNHCRQRISERNKARKGQ